MSNFHRIQWIDTEIKKNRYPNSRTISEEFEISTRQALRDIEYLKCSLNAPIQYNHKYKGYFYTEEAYRIPSEMLSVTDSRLLDKVIRSYTGEELAGINKLRSIFTYDALSRTEEEIVQKLNYVIEQAIKVELEVNGLYIPGKVFPLKMEFKNWSNYLTYTIENTTITETIKISDITGIKLIDEAFNKFNPGIYKKIYNSPYEATIVFEDETSVMEFIDSSKFINYLITQDRVFKIVKPRWLKEKMIKKLEHIYKNNLP